MRYRAVLTGVAPQRQGDKIEGVLQVYGGSREELERWANEILKHAEPQARVEIYERTEIKVGEIKGSGGGGKIA